jgi:hypothetical protein
MDAQMAETFIIFEFHSIDNGGTLLDTYPIASSIPPKYTLTITSVQARLPGIQTKLPITKAVGGWYTFNLANVQK